MPPSGPCAALPHVPPGGPRLRPARVVLCGRLLGSDPGVQAKLRRSLCFGSSGTAAQPPACVTLTAPTTQLSVSLLRSTFLSSASHSWSLSLTLKPKTGHFHRHSHPSGPPADATLVLVDKNRLFGRGGNCCHFIFNVSFKNFLVPLICYSKTSPQELFVLFLMSFKMIFKIVHPTAHFSDIFTAYSKTSDFKLHWPDFPCKLLIRFNLNFHKLLKKIAGE